MTTWMIANRERVLGVLAATSWFAPALALAAIDPVRTPTSVNKSGFTDIDETIIIIFNIVITVAGVAFVVLFLLGGIQYLAAAGNEETTKKARQLLLDAVIGLAIVVTAWAVGTYVLQLLGLSDDSNSLQTLPAGI